MNLFARPVLEAPAGNTRRVLWAFVALFVVGASLRGIACIYTVGILHPDEHQQFLEQAYRMIHGYGKKFWEQDRGMRHPIYPAFLAAQLRLLEGIGIRDPLVQTGIIRFVVAVLTLASWAFFAWQFQRRGDTFTALMLMFLFALSPDIIFVQTHPLSEIAATIPYLLAVCWLDRRPILAGVMLGVCFGFRFQMGFLIGGTVFLAGLGTRFRPRGPFLRFVLAALGSLLILGIVDWFVFGRLFHSPIEYFYANIVQGMSRLWGVHPWYQYFEWFWEHGGVLVVSLLALMAVGAVCEWKLGFLLALFALAHIAVAHKEARFMLPVAPLAFALIVCAIKFGIDLLAVRRRPAATAVVVTVFVAIFIWRIDAISWEPRDPRHGYRSASLLLYEAGQRPDITGIGVLGIHLAEYGNYFFLQRDVPMIGVIDANDPYFPDDPWLTDRRINYLIAPPHQIHLYEKYQPEPLSTRGGWTLYRVNRSAS